MSADLVQLNGESGGLVTLYTLDATALGDVKYYFVNHMLPGGAPISFGGIPYMTVPVQTEGWDFSSSGPQPTPTFSLSNVNKLLLNAVLNKGDLVGAIVTRIRTFERYLDHGADPSPDKFIGPEVYTIEQMSYLDDTIIQWTLSSPLARMGVKLPAKQILKDKFPGVGRTRIG
jgi:lambda family phage minor tail protein L